MAKETDNPITQLLASAAAGDAAAKERLWATVYQELRRMAQARMSHEAPGRTLQPTALVNEAYLKLMGTDAGFENRRHFFAAAAQAMHRILVDDARKRRRMKRGGAVKPVRLDEESMCAGSDPEFVLEVDEALDMLNQDRPDLVELVRLRYFAGLGLDETAEVLGVARRTVVNKWRLARAMLYGMLSDDESSPPD